MNERILTVTMAQQPNRVTADLMSLALVCQMFVSLPPVP